MPTGSGRCFSEASIQLHAANEVLVNGSRESVGPASCRSVAMDQQDETVSKFLSERKTWHDILSPGNKLPGYYPASLRDDKYLSLVGANDSSPVLQRRVKLMARFRTPGRF